MPPTLLSLSFSFSSLKQGLIFLVVGTTFCSFLVPVTIVLFYFSTPNLRKHPLFFANLCAIALGLVQGAIEIYIANTVVLNQHATGELTVVVLVLNFLTPVCVESILLFRVAAVYHRREFSLARLFWIYLPIVLFKGARFTNAITGICRIQRELLAGDYTDVLSGIRLAWGSSSTGSFYIKTEWILHVVDNGYMSALFLLRLKEGRKMTGMSGSAVGSSRSASGPNSYAKRLKALFWIAVSNFVFPVLFDIAQLILIFRPNSFYAGINVYTVNCYVSIVGVLFATIWSSHYRSIDYTNTSEGD